MRYKKNGEVYRPTGPIYEALELDGGWLTLEGIMLATRKSNRKFVNDVLKRLKGRGWVETRKRGTGLSEIIDATEFKAIIRDDYGERE